MKGASCNVELLLRCLRLLIHKRNAQHLTLWYYWEIWLRGQDLNLRPSGYEPDELPGCSTPRYTIFATGKISRFLPLAKYRCDEPEGFVASAEHIALAICSCSCGTEAKRVALRATLFGFGPDCVEKIIILRLADLAATYSPAS